MNPKEAIEYLSNLPFNKDVSIKICFPKKAIFKNIDELIEHCSAVTIHCQNDYNLNPNHINKIIKPDNIVDYYWSAQPIGECVNIYYLFSSIEDKLVWENGDSELFDKSFLNSHLLNKECFRLNKYFEKYIQS